MVRIMPNMTLSLPEELHELIKKHKEVRWSEVARQAMWDYAQKLELLDGLTGRSELTEEDAMELDRLVKEALAQRHSTSGRTR
jgi:hypothetical protein